MANITLDARVERVLHNRQIDVRRPWRMRTLDVDNYPMWTYVEPDGKMWGFEAYSYNAAGVQRLIQYIRAYGLLSEFADEVRKTYNGDALADTWSGMELNRELRECICEAAITVLTRREEEENGRDTQED